MRAAVLRTFAASQMARPRSNRAPDEHAILVDSGRDHGRPHVPAVHRHCFGGVGTNEGLVGRATYYPVVHGTVPLRLRRLMQTIEANSSGPRTAREYSATRRPTKVLARPS